MSEMPCMENVTDFWWISQRKQCILVLFHYNWLGAITIQQMLGPSKNLINADFVDGMELGRTL